VSKSPPLAHALFAEGIGTFTLVLLGCGSLMVRVAQPGTLDHLGVCLVWGLAVMVLIYATAHVSGTHINPAVSIALAVVGRFPWARVGPYVLVQCIGAITAAVALHWLFGDVADLGATTTTLDAVRGVVVEIAITFLLLFVVAGAATDTRGHAPLGGLAIGATVTLMCLVAGPLTGASMNPARSLGPALVSGELHLLWLYLTAPIVGAIGGVMTYEVFRPSSSAT
jgi:aquaporin NIP